MLRTFGITAVVFCLGVLGGAATYLDRYQSSEALADAFRRQVQSDTAEIASYHVNFPSLIYYARQPVRKVSKPEEIRQLLTRPEGYLMTSDQGWEKLAPEVQANLVKVYECTRFPKPGTLMVLRNKRSEAMALTP